MKLTFFYFEILGSTDTFITDNWGEGEDTQKVLVAICTLEYFSWLYTFIFFRCFSINRLLWNLFCLYHEREHFFSKLHYKQGKNILGLKIALHSPYSGTPKNYIVNELFNQFKARLVAAWIWYSLQINTRRTYTVIIDF